MTSSPDASSDSLDFDEALHQVDLALQDLKDLHALLLTDAQGGAGDRSPSSERRSSPRRTPLEALRAELKRVYQKLDQLEVVVEIEQLEAGAGEGRSQSFVSMLSDGIRLFWRAFKDDFWQAVRFGGLGIVLGWALRSCAN